MDAYFGIHVGNSSICVAICKDEERIDVLANDAGDRITPAILQWTPNGLTIGKTAQLELFRNTTNTIVRNKQLLNSNISNEELDYMRSQVPFKINKNDHDIKYELLYDGKQCNISPREILGWIFKKILSIAESAVGGKKEINAVITVPLYYPFKSVQLVKEIAKRAGFNILQVIDEPSAAVLGCGLELNPKKSPYFCIVYRVGGVSVDITLLMIQDGIFSIIESIHKYNVGGSKLTEKLAEFLTSEFKRQYRTAEVNERSKYKLLAAAETVKQVLSIQNLAHSSCESIGGGYDFNCSVSRARFENIIAPLIPEIVAPIMDIIKKTNLSVEKIAKVVTCGGSMKIPKLQETVKKLLPFSEIIINLNPDEIIALGAAKQGGYCFDCKKLPDSLAIDAPSLATSLVLWIKQGENETSYLIPENTLVPYRERYDLISLNESVAVGIADQKSKNLAETVVNNITQSSKLNLDLDISREGKGLITIIDMSSKEKTYLKFDLNELSKI